MESTPEAVPSGTTAPVDPDSSTAPIVSGEAAYKDMPHEELLEQVYFLRAQLSGAVAAREVAEARVDFMTQDLKRHRERIAQYRKFAMQWRTLATANAESMVHILEEVLAVEQQLAQEPDGRYVPSLASVVLPRKQYDDETFRRLATTPPLSKGERGMGAGRMPFVVGDDGKLNLGFDGAFPGAGLDALITKAGMGARKDGKPLDDPSPDGGRYEPEDRA
jgi:hypothetical protein